MFLSALWLIFAGYAQEDIIALEYYVDPDAGLVNGTPIAITQGQSINESFTASTSALPPGYHVLVIRALNAHNRWSMYERRLFLVQDPSNNLGFPRPVEDIVAAEYFIDTDPGQGNGTAIPTSGGALISESINVSTTGLGVGYHIIAVRTQNAEGRWSMYERRLFLVQDPTDDLYFPRPVSEIVAAEYFIDTDPGVGNATEIPTAGGAIIGESVAIPTNGLTAGFHHIFVRTQNAEGRWSMYEKRRFLIQDPVDDLEFPPNKIVELEYFVDTDPGVGNGISIAVDTPVRLLELTELMLSTGGVGVGMHTLFMRARNEVGIWSPEVSAPFEVVNVNSPSEVDSLALVQFYTELDGENWTNNTNWLAQDQRIANWFGITLNPSGSEVLEIQISNNGLSLSLIHI